MEALLYAGTAFPAGIMVLPEAQMAISLG